MCFGRIIKTKENVIDINVDNTFEKIQDNVTDVMGSLSKLWLMIENVNTANDDNEPAVQMDMVLELLKKTSTWWPLYEYYYV